MIKFRKLFSFSKKEIQSSSKDAKLKDKILGLKLLQAPCQQDHGKILVIIPKATGKAHERNKLKRQIKAIFYEEKLFQNPISSILIVYKEAKSLSFDEIKAFLIKNFKLN